ncbi:uncharacterized protein PFL1_04130 [Pseudozyma flocculosa PF-1]|uniref:Uncharacterized protein n=1 Tax=Pseudozyma flocculosa PF-1 TaxID=1277687 RepID=A0A061H6P7_9BASI|nr:uncharacterized protein PFL1_04130 [Pseudozyma flocculosa PF-1]EPQ28303.1 hypothetical protein PFL1_04130 [Pseudozyma flocculosa PF-1]
MARPSAQTSWRSELKPPSTQQTPRTPEPHPSFQIQLAPIASQPDARSPSRDRQPPPAGSPSALTRPDLPFFFTGQFVFFWEDDHKVICIFVKYLDGDFVRLRQYGTDVLLNAKVWGLIPLNSVSHP